jgi:predicted membrane-bound spermidine synthase
MIAKMLIYLITFLGGGIFLGLEIIASRVLAPYFGNSIYVWGSLISVFLFALSIGYYVGGLLADKLPSFKILALLILGASFFVLIIPLISIPVSIIIVNWDLELRLSALIACLAFFMIPSILNGMITPYVIKLNATKLKTIGQTVGNIYAVSTIGSVTGALSVSFYLIPMIGTRAILYLSGILLIVTSLLSFLIDKIVSISGKAQEKTELKVL